MHWKLTTYASKYALKILTLGKNMHKFTENLQKKTLNV